MEDSSKIFIVSARKRLRVYLIDVFILLVLVVLLQSYFWQVMTDFLWALPTQKKNLVMSNLIRMRGSLNFINFTLIFISYHFSCYYYFNGKTIGSYFIGTRLVSNKFRSSSQYQLGLVESLERVAALLFLSLSWVSPIMMIFCSISLLRKDRRGIADFLGRTYAMNESDFANKLQNDYNNSLPVPISLYQNDFPIFDHKKSA